MLTVVVGFDGSPASNDALALASDLVAACGAARLILAHVYLEDPFAGIARTLYEPALVRAATKTLEQATEERGLAMALRAVSASSPARGLRQLADEERAQLIVVGSSGQGRSGGNTPGGVPQGLLHGSPCAVAIAPSGFATRTSHDIRVIGVAYDASGQAEHALREAAALARTADASLRLIVVLDMPSDDAARAVSAVGFSVATHAHTRRVNAQAKLDAAIARLPVAIDAEGVVADGQAAEELAAQDVDLLFCGSRAYGAAGGVMLGSTSRPLVALAGPPLIVLPHDSGRPVFGLLVDATATPDVG